MVEVGAVLVDFDGTACLHDAASDLLAEFSGDSFMELDHAWERGEVSGPELLSRQAAMLRAPLDDLIRFAVAHCPIDPTFGPFVGWCRARGVRVTIVSDGFAFYIEPLLSAHAIDGVEVITNVWRGPAGLAFPNGHPHCVGCGTCKKRAVEEARASFGSVAFVGEGPSDRFGARYADLTFAKVGESLLRHCEAEGIPYVPWMTFDDVRRGLEGATQMLGPLGGEPCPGWMEPA